MMLWTSGLVNCLSMLVASWATEVWQLVLLIGVLCGLAGAVLYAPVLLWLNGSVPLSLRLVPTSASRRALTPILRARRWWHDRRGLASGIIFAGTGVGGTIFPFALSGLLDRYGFPTMCRAWACITAGVYALALLYLKPRVPLVKPRGERVPWLSIHDFRFVKDPVVLAMVRRSLSSSFSACSLSSARELTQGPCTQTATTFLSSMGYMPVSLYLPIYTSSLSTPGKANLLVAIFNLSSSVGSTLTGYTSDYSLPVTLAVMGTAGAVLSLTAWGLASSLGAVFAFAVLFAAFSQVCSCVSRSRSSSLLCLSVALSLALSLLTGRRADLVLDLPPARPQSLGRRRPRRRRRQPALVDHDLLPVRRRAWRRVDRRPVHLDGPVRGEAGRRRAVRLSRAPPRALALALARSTRRRAWS